jgi:molybdopterin molybdotransferase
MLVSSEARDTRHDEARAESAQGIVSLDAALAALASVAPSPRLDTVALDQADGRRLAHAVRALRSSPPAAAAAMDGYAVRECDLAVGQERLKIIGRSFAGAAYDGIVRPGECVRIFTGARIPDGADRVIPQEAVSVDGPFAVIVDAPGGKRHVRAAGSDFAWGDLIAPAGLKLTPQSLIAIAGADVGAVEVFARPRVSIICTGDELAAPGEAGAREDAIPESVSFGVAALAARWGGRIVRRARVGDQLLSLREAASEALADSDLVVVLGGASVGERDHAKAMFAHAGLELAVPKVAIRPGKPVWFGRAAGKAIVGLPGNPSAAFVTARLFLAPLIVMASGGAAREALAWRRVRLAADLPACDGRETLIKARHAANGVAPVDNQDSSSQASLAIADCLIRRQPGDAAVCAGAFVDTLDL